MFHFQVSVPLRPFWDHYHILAAGRKIPLMTFNGPVQVVPLLVTRPGQHLTTPMEPNRVRNAE